MYKYIYYKLLQKQFLIDKQKDIENNLSLDVLKLKMEPK